MKCQSMAKATMEITGFGYILLLIKLKCYCRDFLYYRTYLKKERGRGRNLSITSLSLSIPQRGLYWIYNAFLVVRAVKKHVKSPSKNCQCDTSFQKAKKGLALIWVDFLGVRFEEREGGVKLPPPPPLSKTR